MTKLRRASVVGAGILVLTLCGAARSTPVAGAPAASAGDAGVGAVAGGDYLAANVALHDDDFAYASEHLLRALAADPSNVALRRQAFLAASLAGRPEAVLLASGLRGDALASLARGDALAVDGRWDEAARVFAAIPPDGGLIDTLRPLLLAWCEVGGGHPDLALALLTPFADGTRLPGLYALHAAAIADLAGHADTAIRMVDIERQSVRSPGLEGARIVASIEARHGRIGVADGVIASLGQALPALGLAAPRIDAALAAPPIRNAREGLAEAYLAAASLIASEPDSGGPAALLMVRDALALDPALSAARLLASDLDGTLGVPAAGLAVLAPIGPADPLSPLADLRRAELDEALGRRAAAAATLSALTAADPSAALPWQELGELLTDEGHDRAGIAALDRALADTPAADASGWQILFDRAIAESDLHDRTAAEADLREALRRSPDQPYVLNYLGYSLAEQGRDLAEARTLIGRALAAEPDNAAFLDSFGWVMLEQGDVAAGVRTLEQAAERTPEDPTVNDHLGVGYWREGRLVAAENQWEQALILGPDAADRPRIEARLREARAALGDAGHAAAATRVEAADGTGRTAAR